MPLYSRWTCLHDRRQYILLEAAAVNINVHVVCRLSLEWNCVGAFDGGVAYLAEGLAANGSLEKLDIRSNQVSHKGAEEIAAMLKKNATLKELGEDFVYQLL